MSSILVSSFLLSSSNSANVEGGSGRVTTILSDSGGVWITETEWIDEYQWISTTTTEKSTTTRISTIMPKRVTSDIRGLSTPSETSAKNKNSTEAVYRWLLMPIVVNKSTGSPRISTMSTKATSITPIMNNSYFSRKKIPIKAALFPTRVHTTTTTSTFPPSMSPLTTTTTTLLTAKIELSTIEPSTMAITTTTMKSVTEQTTISSSSAMTTTRTSASTSSLTTLSPATNSHPTEVITTAISIKNVKVAVVPTLPPEILQLLRQEANEEEMRELQQKRKEFRGETGVTNSSGNQVPFIVTPVPSLEQLEPEVDEVDPLLGEGGGKYGSGNLFRRARHYYRPKFLVLANVRTPDISSRQPNYGGYRGRIERRRKRIRRLPAWMRTIPPDFCNEDVLIHEECDSIIDDLSHGQYRWSFSLEYEGVCLLYHDPCPYFKRNSFRSLSQCIGTCWRRPSSDRKKKK